MPIEDLQKSIKQFVDQRQWGQFHNPKDLAISLSLETSEVLEHFQWKSPQEVAAHSAEHKQELADELADVFWYVSLLAESLEVDLESAVANKLQANQQRYSVEKSRGNHKKYTELKDDSNE